jgi:two-component system, LytTR family, sensor kinase
MVHPILSNFRNTAIYLLFWMLVTAISIFVSVYMFNLTLWIAFSDSIIYNLTYAILGIGLWYNIRYKNFEKINFINRFIYHTSEAIIISVIWVLLCYFILTTVFSANEHNVNKSSGYLPFTFLGGIVYYILITLFYYLVISYNNLQEKIRNESNLHTLIKEAELSLLKSQINPHFLFNSLNSISSLTVTNPLKAREMIIKLSEFLRHSIGHKEQQMTTLNEEMGHLMLYLEIEKVRFGDRLHYEFDISDSCRNFPIPVMLFQPLLENAIKHGVYESTEPITIKFSCNAEQNGITAVLTNNFDPEAPPRKGNKLGLKNVENRLKLIYQSDSLMKVTKQNNIFKVEIHIPERITA